MILESNKLYNIPLKQDYGNLSAIFPLATTKQDIYWERRKYLVRGLEPQSIELTHTQKQDTVDLTVPTQLTKFEELNRTLAEAKLEQALEDELADCIPLLEGLDFKVEATTAEHDHSDNSDGTWSDKVQYPPLGSAAIYRDLTLLCAKLHTQMGERGEKGEILTHSSNHLTLVVPDTHIPFLLAKTGAGESALTMIKILLPELKLLAVPKLESKQGPCALLLCTSDVFGPVGYTVVEKPAGLVELQRIEENRCKLYIPEHKLVIVNPEQMAVLTGI